MQTVLVDFFVELLTRLFSKSPKFFVVIQWISGVIGFFTGAMMLLDYLNITLGGWVAVFSSKAMLICALASLVIAKLPNQDPPKPKDGEQTGEKSSV